MLSCCCCPGAPSLFLCRDVVSPRFQPRISWHSEPTSSSSYVDPPGGYDLGMELVSAAPGACYALGSRTEEELSRGDYRGGCSLFAHLLFGGYSGNRTAATNQWQKSSWCAVAPPRLLSAVALPPGASPTFRPLLLTSLHLLDSVCLICAGHWCFVRHVLLATASCCRRRQHSASLFVCGALFVWAFLLTHATSPPLLHQAACKHNVLPASESFLPLDQWQSQPLSDRVHHLRTAVAPYMDEPWKWPGRREGRPAAAASFPMLAYRCSGGDDNDPAPEPEGICHHGRQNLHQPLCRPFVAVGAGPHRAVLVCAGVVDQRR